MPTHVWDTPLHTFLCIHVCIHVCIRVNRRANRMKVLVHDGVGIWLAARRLNQGKFHWPGVHRGLEVELDAEQLQALVLGLPWQRIGSSGAITVL